MRATGDVEKQTFRRIEHDNGRKPLTPGCDTIEGARVFFRLFFDRLKFGLDCPGIRERHGQVQAKLTRAQINRFKLQRAFLFRINRKRAIVRRPEPSADQSIRLQARQIDREPSRVR